MQIKRDKFDTISGIGSPILYQDRFERESVDSFIMEDSELWENDFNSLLLRIKWLMFGS